jgi:hypothetical protein
MICETCEREFQDSAVKVWREKKVCPGCFRVLGETQTPDQNRHVQVVKTETMRMTVCPECNAEVHADTRVCPYCRATVKRFDRMADCTKRAAGSTLLIMGSILGLLLFTMIAAVACWFIVGGVGALTAKGTMKEDGTVGGCVLLTLGLLMTTVLVCVAWRVMRELQGRPDEPESGQEPPSPPTGAGTATTPESNSQ